MENKNKKDDLEVVREIVNALESFSENDQERIIRWACEKLGIKSVGVEKKVTVFSDTVSQKIGNTKTRDIKTFVESKNPRSDNHFTAVIAYFYQFEAPEKDRKESINKDNLIEATRLAGFHRIKRPDQTLVNATKVGLLDNVSRGQYRLNSVGENLVAMVLPDTASGSIPIKKKKISRRKSSKKKPEKK